MIPFWTTAIVSLLFKWGWEFASDGAPWVAHLVWPIPIHPSTGFCFILSAKLDNLPLNFLTSKWSLLNTATPAESYPLYSNFDNPFIKNDVAFPLPKYPTIPHILNSSFLISQIKNPF